MKHQFIWRDGMRKKYRKFVVASVSASVVSSMVVPSGMNVHAEQEAFSDVSKDAFYYEAVQNLAARGIINGFQDGTFRPNERVTRGQAAVMLASVLNLNTQNVNNPGFKDVPTNSWYYHSIAELVNAGIITGFSDKTFKPNEALTRAQVAAIISLGFQLTENKQAVATFKDISSTDWYAGFVGALVENGIAKGISQTSFGPNNIVTRGQLATFIYRSEGKINTKSVIESVTNTDVVINGKTYQLSEQVKPILNENNKAALNHALISFESSDSTITKIKYLGITASGQSEMSGHVVLDGKNGAINGDVKISSDFVTVQNLTVEGNFEIGEELQNSFYSNKLVVLGKTLILKQTTSLAKANSNYAAAEKKKIKIIFENSTLRIVEVSKNDTSIEVTGETTLLQLIVASNASIEASDGLVIPKITLQIGAEFVEINASVTELTVDSMDAITLTGNANIEHVIVNTGAEVNLDIKGEIKKIEVTNKDAQLIVGKETKIKDICLPEGSKIEEIIKNYDEVKANIENINGEKNPDAKPSHSSGGGGGAPADHTAPTVVTNVTGTSVDVEPDAVGGVQNLIAWDENAASDLDHYEVYRLEANEVALPKIIFVDAGTENYTDTEVIPGTTYTYTVFAVDRNGNKSAVSNAVSVVTASDQFPSIPPVDLSDKATMENFNTHANMDYLGVNVGWNFSDLDFSKVKEIRVNLYDSEGIVGTNTGNLENLAELYESGENQFSTPFIVAELAYRQSEDEYWTFGEVDWSEVKADEPLKAELVLVGLDGTEYKFENTNLMDSEGYLEEILPYYPLGLVFGADSVEGMRAALENADLGLNRDMYDDLTDEGKESVAKIMYFFMDVVKDFFEEFMNGEVEISSVKISVEEDEFGFFDELLDIQYFFDIAVNFESNKLSLVELFADGTATSEDLSDILHSFLWGNDDEYLPFLAMILLEDSDLDLTPYIEKHFEKEYFEELYDYLVAYENLTDEERIEVFNTVKGKPISNSFDTVIEYIYEAIDDVLENKPLYIEKAFTYDLSGDGKLDAYLIQTNRAIDDSSIVEEYFTVDGAQIDSIDTGGSSNDEYFWINFDNSDLGTDQLPQLSVTAGAFKDLEGISSSELTVKENVEEDGASPVIASVTTANSTDSSVDVQILTKEAGTAYYVVLPAEAAAPSDSQVLDGNYSDDVLLSGSKQVDTDITETINITGLTASTDYKVYVVVEDEMENVSEVAVTEFSTSEQLEELAVPEEIISLPVSPAPEAESPAPESGDLAPVDENPASEDEDLAPEDENPAPEDEDPAPEDENPASEDEDPTPEDESPAPEDENPAPEDENSTLPDATIGKELNDDTALEIGEGEDNSEDSENPIELIIVDETEENEEPISYSATLSKDKQTITIYPNN